MTTQENIASHNRTGAPASSLDAATKKAVANAKPERRRWSWVAFLPVVLALWCAGCQDPRPDAGAAVHFPIAGDAGYGTNVMQEGDVINITFQNSTNFNTVQKVSIDGTVNLETVGLVKAAGRTPEEMQAEVLQRYRSQVKEDTVTVKIVSVSAVIYVSGAVYHPGRIPLERPMTVLEAVMEAGGFDPTRAKLADVRVLRIERGVQQTYHVNAKRMLEGEDNTPFYVKPFDIIHVPMKTFNL